MNSIIELNQTKKCNCKSWLSFAAVSGLVVGAAMVAYKSFYRRSIVIEKTKCVVIITGCDSGFGYLTAVELSKQGYRVIATCMTVEGAERLNDIVAAVVYCDVTKEECIIELSSVVNHYMEEHKSEKIKLWGLINNAGICTTGYIDWLPMEVYRNVMEVNYFAPIRITKEFLPLLKKANGARIVNLSSLAGFLSGHFMGPYSASKHALEGVGKAMREELAPWNIHVCHMNPGFMGTNIINASSEATRKVFLNAPTEITEQYEQSFLDDMGETVKSIMEDPMIVVNAISDTLTLRKPTFWRFPGYQASIARYLTVLPLEILDMFSVGDGYVYPTPQALETFQSTKSESD